MIFVTLGYGVPSSIITDENYNIYLKEVFNKIFDLASEKQSIILFSGGKTDMVKPYKRTEAQEMAKLFKNLKQRSFLKDKTKEWKIVLRTKPISSLKNILDLHQYIQNKNNNEVIIFCEETRKNKIEKISKRILKSKYKIIPIDFDNSKLRYQGKLIKEKEEKELNLALWALKNDENLKRHHELYANKLKFLRQNKGESYDKLKEWWEKELKEINLK